MEKTMPFGGRKVEGIGQDSRAQGAYSQKKKKNSRQRNKTGAEQNMSIYGEECCRPSKQLQSLCCTPKSSFLPHLPSCFFSGRMELSGQHNPSVHSLSASGRKLVDQHKHNLEIKLRWSYYQVKASLKCPHLIL